jgi:hypothetical protein
MFFWQRCEVNEYLFFIYKHGNISSNDQTRIYSYIGQPNISKASLKNGMTAFRETPAKPYFLIHRV